MKLLSTIAIYFLLPIAFSVKAQNWHGIHITGITYPFNPTCEEGEIAFYANFCGLPGGSYQMFKNGTLIASNNFTSSDIVSNLGVGSYHIIFYKQTGAPNCFQTTLDTTIYLQDLATTNNWNCEGYASLNSTIGSLQSSFDTTTCQGSIPYFLMSFDCDGTYTLFKDNSVLNTQSFNNGIFSDGIFNNLSPGEYKLSISNGCGTFVSPKYILGGSVAIELINPSPLNPISDTFTFHATTTNLASNEILNWHVNGLLVQSDTSHNFVSASLINGDIVSCSSFYKACLINSNPIVIIDTNINIQVIAFIEGYYQSNYSMSSTLLNQGSSTQGTICDSIKLYLIDPISLQPIFDTCTTIGTNGSILVNNINSSLIGNSYYIALKHRNSIETWSATPVTITNSTIYNFTDAASKAYGNNQVEVEPNVFAFYSGDMDQNGYLELDDYNLWDVEYQAGYPHSNYAPDLDGNGYVELDDYNIWDLNYQNGVYIIRP